MSGRTSILPGILTAVLLILVALVFLFGLLVALNGVSEKQGLLAMAIWFFSHLVIVALACFSAQWISKTLISKARWGSFPSVSVAVLSATLIGTAASFLAILFSILLSGIR